MRDPRITKLAHVLLDHSVKIKSKEPLLIEVYGEGLPLAKQLVKEAYERGAYPYIKLVDEELQRLQMEGTTLGHSQLIQKWDLQMMEDIKASIRIYGSPNDMETAHVPEERRRIFRQGYKPVLDQLINHTKWVLLNYPNKSNAQKAGMSLEDFEDFYFNVCTLDYGKMDRAMDVLKQLMDQTDHVRILGEGTDLQFSIKGLGSIKCSGARNIPDGEIYTAPVKHSVNGKLTYNTKTIYQGTTFENIQFTFRDGKIVESTANHNEKLNHILDSDEGARYIGEFALGVNPYILEPMNDTLFDEKIAGSFHFTPGQSYKNESYNGNDSEVHWDIVNIQRPEYGGGEIWFDDQLIRKDGLFVLKELQPLNPEQLK